jgi:hypothetical protein
LRQALLTQATFYTLQEAKKSDQTLAKGKKLSLTTLRPVEHTPCSGRSVDSGVYRDMGWPIALLGLVLSLPFGGKIPGVNPLLFMLIYPAMQFLLIRSVISKPPHRLELILLHLLIMISFLVVWSYVLNGYDFMLG